MAFEIRLGLEFWFGGQELCNLGQLSEVQFPYLKMEKYKYMSSNVGLVKLDSLYKVSGSRWGLNRWQPLLILPFSCVHYGVQLRISSFSYTKKIQLFWYSPVLSPTIHYLSPDA